MKTYTQMKSIQNFNKKALRGALVAAGMAMASTGVYAATSEPANMTTTAAITSSCSVSASTLTFPATAALNTTTDVTADTSGSLTVACTTGTTTPEIYSATAREMQETTGTATALLPFYLSQTALAPADDLPTTSLAAEAMTSYTADGSAKIVPIYGRIPTASFAGKPVGSYSATIVISVDYS